MARLSLRAILHDVEQDRFIWAHKSHLERPALVPTDGPIGAFRKWARQLYEGPLPEAKPAAVS